MSSADLQGKASVSASDHTMRLRALRLPTFLILIALIQALDIPSKISVLLMNDPRLPGPGWGGRAVAAHLALSPLATLAVIYFAVRGRLTYAVLALDATSLLGWLSMLPSVVIHWGNFSGPGMSGLYTVWNVLVQPVTIALAALLAWRREHIVLAAILAALPTILGALGVIVFATGIAIYGF